jgi:hypothetical protein
MLDPVDSEAHIPYGTRIQIRIRPFDLAGEVIDDGPTQRGAKIRVFPRTNDFRV